MPHPVPPPLEVMHRIAVFRALQLGDLLVAVPALRALRRAAPRAEITLVGLPWAAAFVERFSHLVDDFIPFPGHPALPEREPDLEAWPAFLSATRNRTFELAVQLHGSGRVANPLVALFGARHTAAFVEPGAWNPPGLIVSYPDIGPEVDRLLALVSALGADAGDASLEFPVRASDHAEIDAILPAATRPLVVIHPGARARSRRWPARHFAAVADALAARGLDVVLTGTEPERPLVRAVAANMAAPPLDLAGRTSLGGLAALLTRARLLVSNDTGVSHLAAALGTPSIVLFSHSDPSRWASVDRRRHVVVDARLGVEPAPVIAAALAQLRAEAVYA